MTASPTPFSWSTFAGFHGGKSALYRQYFLESEKQLSAAFKANPSLARCFFSSSYVDDDGENSSSCLDGTPPPPVPPLLSLAEKKERRDGAGGGGKGGERQKNAGRGVTHALSARRRQYFLQRLLDTTGEWVEACGRSNFRNTHSHPPQNANSTAEEKGEKVGRVAALRESSLPHSPSSSRFPSSAPLCVSPHNHINKGEEEEGPDRKRIKRQDAPHKEIEQQKEEGQDARKESASLGHASSPPPDTPVISDPIDSNTEEEGKKEKKSACIPQHSSSTLPLHPTCTASFTSLARLLLRSYGGGGHNREKNEKVESEDTLLGCLRPPPPPLLPSSFSLSDEGGVVVSFPLHTPTTTPTLALPPPLLGREGEEERDMLKNKEDEQENHVMEEVPKEEEQEGRERETAPRTSTLPPQQPQPFRCSFTLSALPNFHTACRLSSSSSSSSQHPSPPSIKESLAPLLYPSERHELFSFLSLPSLFASPDHEVGGGRGEQQKDTAKDHEEVNEYGISLLSDTSHNGVATRSTTPSQSFPSFPTTSPVPSIFSFLLRDD